MAFSVIKTSVISLTVLSTLLFFYTVPFNPSPYPPTVRRALLNSTTLPKSCSSYDPDRTNGGLIDYSALHYCFLGRNSLLSIPVLSVFIIFYFYVLIKTAQDHFSIVTTKLSSHLNLTPSMGAITLLALGNGAPDVFSSVAAVRSGQYRTGFGAILSAGTFVSAFVVGFVAIYAAPFSLDPAPFIRDVLFYMIAALFLFWVYLSGEIFLWQAIGFVGFYIFFVGFVFWMDFGIGMEKKKSVGVNGSRHESAIAIAIPDCEIGEVGGSLGKGKSNTGLVHTLSKVKDFC